MSSPLFASDNRLLPAVVTPLTPTRQLDAASAERLVERLLRAGVGGFYVTGSTGEGIYLDPALRRQMAELVVGLSRGRATVIVHVGAIQGSLAFELAEHAGRIGADAVASIPPFAGGYSWDEVYAYYRELAGASRVPVVAYHIPGLTGHQFSAQQLGQFLAIPNVAGLKFTDLNLYTMERLSCRMAPGQVLYNGMDEILSLGMQVGAHGGIGTTYNFLPEQFVQIYRACCAGRFADAVQVQHRVNEALERWHRFPWLAATKQILYWQGAIDHPTCALPRAGLNAAQQQELRDSLADTVLGPTLVR